MRSLRDWLVRGLLPAAIGHATAMALGLATALGGAGMDRPTMALAALAVVPLAAAWRRRARELGLAGCSFLVAALHGAGLALVPALLPLCGPGPRHAGVLLGAIGDAAAHLLSSAALIAALVLVAGGWRAARPSGCRQRVRGDGRSGAAGEPPGPRGPRGPKAWIIASMHRRDAR